MRQGRKTYGNPPQLPKKKANPIDPHKIEDGFDLDKDQLGPDGLKIDKGFDVNQNFNMVPKIHHDKKEEASDEEEDEGEKNKDKKMK